MSATEGPDFSEVSLKQKQESVAHAREVLKRKRFEKKQESEQAQHNANQLATKFKAPEYVPMSDNSGEEEDPETEPEPEPEPPKKKKKTTAPSITVPPETGIIDRVTNVASYCWNSPMVHAASALLLAVFIKKVVPVDQPITTKKEDKMEVETPREEPVPIPLILQ
jgi:hypothetical protein